MKETFIKALVQSIISKSATITYSSETEKLTVTHIYKNRPVVYTVNFTKDEEAMLRFLIAHAKTERYKNVNL